MSMQNNTEIDDTRNAVAFDGCELCGSRGDEEHTCPPGWRVEMFDYGCRLDDGLEEHSPDCPDYVYCATRMRDAADALDVFSFLNYRGRLL